jgi:BirA family biotin operon repressor/biotin-[acetyl-CoA-carboxylase] ligase
VLLRPRELPAALIPLAAGVAVAEAVAGCGVASELKWPNDVLVAGRKLAGVLAEAGSFAQGVEWVVLGIGVNVALDPAELPPPLRAAVTSLRAEGAGSAEPGALAAAVIARLAVWYDALGANPGGVVAAWRSRAVPWWGSAVEVRTGDSVVAGRLLGVDDDGALVIEPPGAAPRRFVSGEVTQVRPAADR